jgi:WD40 repeat protein
MCQVWRLSWNVTGTILASSGDDGYVRLWKGLGLLITALKHLHDLGVDLLF